MTPGRDDSDDTLVIGILEAVSDALDLDPMDLAPLGSLIDPEALEQVVESADVDVEIVLTLYGCRVEIDNSGNVSAAPLANSV